MGVAWCCWVLLGLGELHVGQGLTGASGWLQGLAAAGLDLTKFLPTICQGGCTLMGLLIVSTQAH